MKKTILILILFFTFFQIEKASAQGRQHLADSNAVWTMLNTSFWFPSSGPPYATYSQNQFFITNTDTFIDGNRFSKLYIKNLSGFGGGSFNVQNIGYLGEDSLNRIVIILNDSLNGFSQGLGIGFESTADTLFYKPIVVADFSKNTTDSFQFYDNIYGVVEDNYKDEVRGDSLKIQRIRLNKNDVIQNDFYDFYERVGNLREGVLYPFLQWFENSYKLICYTENGIELAPDSCDFTLNLNEQDISNNHTNTNIRVVNNYLFIQFESLVDIDNAEIVLYDMNGKEIQKSSIEVTNNICFVPLQNMSNGMYITNIKVPKSKVDIRKKIVVVN